MKAIVYDNYGPPEVLRVEDIEKPVPRPNEVLIKIHAVEATKADCELRSFNFPVKWFTPPLRLAMGIRKPRNRVLGAYFAGEIEACGKDVTRFAAGDKVFGCAKLRMRAYAEYACYPESYSITKMPANASFEVAACSLLGGLNALHFLTLSKLANGERILINGAGGSIGLCAIQIAKSLGAEVTAVDKPEKLPAINRAGADHFIDYTQERFAENGKRYDIVFNMVPQISLPECSGSLNKTGRYIMGNPRFADMLRSAFFGRKTGQKAYFQFAGETLPELETLRTLIENKTIKPILDRILPFEQAAEAHRLVENETRLGSIALRP